MHTAVRVVTLHLHDVEAFAPDPGGPSVALFDDVPLDGPGASVLSELTVHRVTDFATLEELATKTVLAAVVAAWRSELAEVAMRLGTRLIVVTPTLPEGLLDAISRGVDARWASNIADAAAELRLLRSTRPTDHVRHRFVGVRVRFAGGEAELRDLSNDGIAFDISDADSNGSCLAAARRCGARARRSGLPRGVRALVRHVAATAPGRYRIGCALKPPLAPAAETVTQIRDKRALRHARQERARSRHRRRPSRRRRA